MTLPFVKALLLLVATAAAGQLGAEEERNLRSGCREEAQAPGSHAASTRERLEELRRAAMNRSGDAANGRRLFESASLRCTACHRQGGDGSSPGPDLSQVAGKLDRTHLVESVLEPSRQILEGFRATVVGLTDGRVLLGLVSGESPAGFTLVDADGARTEVPASQVAARQSTGDSLMPDDLALRLSTEEFTDLIDYLETLRTGRELSPGEGVTGAVKLPDGFVVEPIATGLTACTAMEVAPDGRVFICEQTGALRLVKDGTLLPEPFVRLPVAATWERGLIGVTLAPGFPSPPHVFVCHVAAAPYPHHVVSRFTARGDRAEAGSEVVLLAGDDQTLLGGEKPDGHQGGALHFGRDGKLYIGIGEQTAGAPSQDLHSLLGKLLRLNPDGSLPPDNPFATSAAGKYRAIWALGLRNPSTFAVEPGSGRILIHDVGGRAEEINEGVAGANYGWPTAEHGPTPDPRFQGPVHHYPTACISGGAFAPADLPWPAEHRGRYYFADFNHGVIRTLDPAAAAASRPFAAGLRRPVDLRFAPGGVLHVLLRNAWVVDEHFRPGTGSLASIRRSAEPR